MKPEKMEELFKGIPRKRLLFLPTPFHKLENLSKKYGVDLYMKRDDLTGPSVFGGNKTRKLEFILGSAMERGVEYFLSVGGYQTNSGMQLAVCCRQCGVNPILYLTDAHSEGSPKAYRANLLLNKIMGCEIHYVHREAGQDLREMFQTCEEQCDRRKRELEREGHKAMVVPAGCVTPEGLISYALAFREILQQSKEMHVDLDHLFHTTGTGGSLPGLLVGKFLLKSEIRITSILCAKPSSGAVGKELICQRTKEVFHRLGADSPSDEKILGEIHMNENFIGEDYAVPSEEGTKAIKELAREEGIMLDPVYTGKGFAGFLEYVKSGQIPKGSKAAFLHTGGTCALFAEEKLTGKIWE
jgi:1-aminocyclopropane-1-carboxylate deaminase/D-cysteine desulfhydrase-like pyridoxal-dependent ACC family enzyme